jgi:hypothetical protein
VFVVREYFQASIMFAMRPGTIFKILHFLIKGSVKLKFCPRRAFPA